MDNYQDISLGFRKQKASIQITSEVIIIFSIFIILILQIYAYWIADWKVVRSEWSPIIYVIKMAAVNKTIVFPKYIALMTLIFALLTRIKATKSNIIYILIIFTYCVIHSVVVIMDNGLVNGLYASNIPLNYFLIFAFLAGQNKKTWSEVTRVIPIVLVTYLVAFLYDFYDASSKFGWVIYQNSSLMTYYSQAFWLSAIYIYKQLSNKNPTKIIYLLLAFLCVAAVIIRSRSWVIQAALLCIITVWAMSSIKGKSAIKFIRFIIILGIILMIASLLLTRYLTPFLTSLLEKGTVDSRSVQYLEMLQQTPWYKWIFGQGMDATYVSGLYGSYSFIDNEFVYLSFHYGVIFAVLYFAPYISAIFSCFKAGKKINVFMLSIGIVVLWIFSINGLSVYNRVLLDIKSMIMPLFAGHIYEEARMVCQEKRMIYENSICSR